AGIRGKRIAFSLTLGGKPRIVPDVERLVLAAVKRFEDLGAKVERIDPPVAGAGEIFRTLWWAGAGFALGALPEEKKALLESALRQVVEEGARISLRSYLEANAAR